MKAANDKTWRLIIVLCCLSIGTAAEDDVHIVVVADQADAALAIMESMARDETPTETQWQALWQSRGYQRLLLRETAMGRQQGFGDKLQNWLLDSANFRQVADYRRAVEAWHHFDATAAGRRAHAYLPKGFVLRANLYPVIKHTRNTFVFDLENDPSIFMTLDPADSPGTVEAIMTHELHHVGMGQCPAQADRERLDARQQRSVDWLSMFGEGLAVLATAGGPMQHPHFYSKPEEYLVWERDLANFHRDVSRVEVFFRAIRDGSMPEGKQRAALFEFIATEQVPQGPAYTVGWKMAAMIERHAGRDALIDSMCDPRELLKRYNEVAAAVRADGVDNLPTWSEEFLHSLYAN